jgi:hypothetical protein
LALPGASGFVALEDVQVGNLTVPQQSFGAPLTQLLSYFRLSERPLAGVVNSSSVSLRNDVSGVLGLGFPRLSRIFASLPDGDCSLLEDGTAR